MKNLMLLLIVIFAANSALSQSLNDLLLDLTSPSEGIVKEALLEIGRRQDANAVPKLLEILKDVDAKVTVRAYCAWALGKIASTSYFDQLEHMAYDPGEKDDVRGQCLFAVARNQADKGMQMVKKIQIQDPMFTTGMFRVLLYYYNTNQEAKEIINAMLSDDEGRKSFEKDFCKIFDFESFDYPLLFKLGAGLTSLHRDHPEWDAQFAGTNDDGTPKSSLVLTRNTTCSGTTYEIPINPGRQISDLLITVRGGIPRTVKVILPTPSTPPIIQVIRKDVIIRRTTINPTTFNPELIEEDENGNGVFEQITRLDGKTGFTLRAERDENEDGKPESIDTFDPETGGILKTETDENKDGRFDAYTYYNKETGKAERMEYDTNHDGRIDSKSHLSPKTGSPEHKELDEDFNGSFEKHHYMDEYSRIIRMETDKNGNGQMEEIVHFKDGYAYKILRDGGGDKKARENGIFESITFYDWQGKVTKMYYDHNENGVYEQFDEFDTTTDKLMTRRRDENEDSKLDGEAYFDLDTGKMYKALYDTDFNGSYDVVKEFNPKTEAEILSDATNQPVPRIDLNE